MSTRYMSVISSDMYRVHLVIYPYIVCPPVLSGSIMCGLGSDGYDGSVVGTASAKFSFKILVRESCV